MNSKFKTTPHEWAGLPEELELATKCRYYLDHPEEGVPAEVVQWMMAWVVAQVEPRRLAGPELARIVDHFAQHFNSASQAIDHVANLLDGLQSKESIAKAHTRDGKNARQLKADRLHMKRLRILLAAIEKMNPEQKLTFKRWSDEYLRSLKH